MAAHYTELLRGSTRAAFHYACQAARPLFASPALTFRTGPTGHPIPGSLAYLRRGDALLMHPRVWLDASATQSAWSTDNLVIAHALDADGDLYRRSGEAPIQLLVSLRTSDGVHVRCLMTSPEAFTQPGNDPLPIDNRWLSNDRTPTLLSAADRAMIAAAQGPAATVVDLRQRMLREVI